jgi:hypothetical protein
MTLWQLEIFDKDMMPMPLTINKTQQRLLTTTTTTVVVQIDASLPKFCPC